MNLEELKTQYERKKQELSELKKLIRKTEIELEKNKFHEYENKFFKIQEKNFESNFEDTYIFVYGLNREEGRLKVLRITFREDKEFEIFDFFVSKMEIYSNSYEFKEIDEKTFTNLFKRLKNELKKISNSTKL